MHIHTHISMCQRKKHHWFYRAAHSASGVYLFVSCVHDSEVRLKLPAGLAGVSVLGSALERLPCNGWGTMKAWANRRWMCKGIAFAWKTRMYLSGASFCSPMPH